MLKICCLPPTVDRLPAAAYCSFGVAGRLGVHDPTQCVQARRPACPEACSPIPCPCRRFVAGDRRRSIEQLPVLRRTFPARFRS
jgi:hypothetical protein